MSEWRRLLAEVDDIQFADPARDLVQQVSAFVADHPEIRPVALREMRARDTKSSAYNAGILARAYGRVADRGLVVALADLLPKLKTLHLRTHVIFALGANRHDERPMYVGAGFPIREEEVRTGLHAYARVLRKEGHAGAEFRTLMQVLAYSQDLDPRIEHLVEAMAASSSFEDHSLGVYCLSKSQRSEALAWLANLMKSPDERSSVILGPAAEALLRTRERANVFLVLDRFARADFEVEAERVLLNKVATLASAEFADRVVAARLRAVLLGVAGNPSSPRSQRRALVWAARELERDRKADDAFDALRRLATDANQSLNNRTFALTHLAKLAQERPEQRDWFWDIAASEREPAVLRVTALRCWVSHATSTTRDAMRKALSGLRAQPGGRLDAEIRRARQRLSADDGTRLHRDDRG